MDAHFFTLFSSLIPFYIIANFHFLSIYLLRHSSLSFACLLLSFILHFHFISLFLHYSSLSSACLLLPLIIHFHSLCFYSTYFFTCNQTVSLLPDSSLYFFSQCLCYIVFTFNPPFSILHYSSLHLAISTQYYLCIFIPVFMLVSTSRRRQVNGLAEREAYRYFYIHV